MGLSRHNEVLKNKKINKNERHVKTFEDHIPTGEFLEQCLSNNQTKIMVAWLAYFTDLR